MIHIVTKWFDDGESKVASIKDAFPSSENIMHNITFQDEKKVGLSGEQRREDGKARDGLML